MITKQFPKYFNLIEYVQDALYELISTHGNPEVKTFCELNRIVNMAIETRSVESSENSWDDWLFRLGVKFDRKVGSISPLGEREHEWLEHWIGAVLTVYEINQYDEGGGYVYYALHNPIGKDRIKMDPKFPYGPRWTGCLREK